MTIHELLQKYIQRKKLSRSGFTMRNLANQLEVSPSFLSRVLSNTKPLPYSLFLKLKGCLEIEDEVFESLRQSYFREGVVKVENPDTNVAMPLESWDLAEKRTASILRNWFYLPILEFLTLKNFDGSIETIAKRLSVSPTTVEVALREMISLGLVSEENGRYAKNSKKIRWGSSKSLAEIRTFHYQMMQKAQDELMKKTGEEDFEKRLITGITVTASPEKIAEAKRKLSDALHQIANELARDQGTEVYHLSAQLFPLTKTN